MFCTEVKTVKARKQHRCTWCNEPIAVGEEHAFWKSVDDGWSTSRMHPECHEACSEELHEWGDNEYRPYSNERPRAACTPQPADPSAPTDAT